MGRKITKYTKMNNYLPQRGDIIKIDFNPKIGHEQGGYRPAIIVSPDSYNLRENIIFVCPITSKIKNHPYEVLLRDLSTQGVVLTNHMKSVDKKSRRFSFVEKSNSLVLQEILAKIRTLFE